MGYSPSPPKFENGVYHVPYVPLKFNQPKKGKEMSKTVIGLLCAVGFFIVVGVFAIVALMGLYNSAVQQEAGLKAQYTQNQNNLSQYSNKIGEMVQVPTMYKNDFKEVLEGALKGRYGANGSQATFQWLKEHQIQFDSSLYAKIQSTIESGRTHFETEQKLLIDKKRVYEVKLQSMPGGFFLGLMGFPRVDLDSYKIVTSGYSDEAFKTGQENGLKLR